MKPGIDPTVDYAFKRLFGVPQTRALLISLIEAVLEPPPDQRIAQLELINPFNHKESPTDKLSVLDIKARDQRGRQFNVEMQMLSHSYLSERILYYWAKFHQQQIQEGDRYEVLRPTVCICFLNGALFPGAADYRLQFELWERRHNVAFTGQIGIFLVELGKFGRGHDEVVTPLDRWAWFLKHGAELDPESVPANLDTPEIRRALEELVMFSQTEVERDQYEARLKWIRDEEARMQDAIEQGILAGRIQSLQLVLGEPIMPAAELLKLGVARMRAITEELERHVRARTAPEGTESE